jgi:hypothetical protein
MQQAFPIVQAVQPVRSPITAAVPGVPPLRPVPVVQTVRWANYDASNPVESSGTVGKNFPFDLRIEALHRFEPGNRVELA